MNKILLLATTSYAGMGPYVLSIINSVIKYDNISFFVIERDDQYFSRNIEKKYQCKGIIKREPTPSKLKTLISLITGARYSFSKEIIEYCKAKDIKIVHALNSLTDLSLVKVLSSNYNLLYTIHDLIPHEAKKAFYKVWRQNKLYSKINSAIEISQNLLTNSVAQFENLNFKYSSKNNFYIPFPSILTEEIKLGRKIPPELKNIGQYILFFGRIEEYKGISILISAFISAHLGSNIKLIIAGKGDIQQKYTSNDIIYINRYIDDQEIAYLYKHAMIVVYPYISATQSGVLSIASFFKTPIITSDVPFFREVLGNDYIGLFKNKDVSSLTIILKKFVRMNQQEKNILKEQLFSLYEKTYSDRYFNNKLINIYNRICNLSK